MSRYDRQCDFKLESLQYEYPAVVGEEPQEIAASKDFNVQGKIQLSFAVATMASAKGETTHQAPGRTRASVACTGCRQKRIKCVTTAGNKVCNYCQDNGLECVFKNDDERKRPRSRVFIRTLLEHMELLEKYLKEIDGDVLPQPRFPGPQPQPRQLMQPQQAQLQPQSTQPVEEAAQQVFRSMPEKSPDYSFDVAQLTSQDYGLVEEAPLENELQRHMSASNNTCASDAVAPPPVFDSRVETLRTTADEMHSLLFDVPPLTYDSATGQLRHWTPTTSYQLYADQLTGFQRIPQGSWHLRQRLHHMINELDLKTHDHLMSCFWTYYNSTMQLVDQTAFERDKDSDKLHYSGFLHICCLAIGFRFADKSRPDIKALDRGDRHSSLQINARHFVETELENLRGLTTIQGLLILGDLEYAVGRDRQGWMYASLACRFAFELGLTMDHTKSNLPRSEIELRYRLLRACVFYDRIWAIFSGHPTVIRTSHLALTGLHPVYSPRPGSAPGSPEQTLESSADTAAWDALLRLMELAVKVVGHVAQVVTTATRDQDAAKLMAAASLHSELNTWQRQLPPPLRWNTENFSTSSGIFFFMHQLFHSTVIHLHCSFVSTTKSQVYQGLMGVSQVGPTLHFEALSQRICLENAVSIVQIMDECCKKLGVRSASVFIPQSTCVALTTLLANLSDHESTSGAAEILRHVRTLMSMLKSMAEYYRVAEDICTVANHLLPPGVDNLAESLAGTEAFQGIPSASSLGSHPSRKSGSGADHERPTFAV
ncbi:uncharacterized protein Z520_12333 [Fonsecaea multimorphosa CBS 102226]|uniref:Zn(2)-C6 fungal-type domain-containing protein n=1 Tax=Fonsecaea multimorphosa CBS 102226 TaxID=1442371 RepID=A0A0D2JNA0_9EURO|nr:uncharacterized protein Z520_12333 [Fonsecaea multimorphosa CBS 102226]KIX91944.1 hypothetical protein Z520_12333 [Fonsecaea multimorphosa CBS 102226]